MYISGVRKTVPTSASGPNDNVPGLQPTLQAVWYRLYLQPRDDCMRALPLIRLQSPGSADGLSKRMVALLARCIHTDMHDAGLVQVLWFLTMGQCCGITALLNLHSWWHWAKKKVRTHLARATHSLICFLICRSTHNPLCLILISSGQMVCDMLLVVADRCKDRACNSMLMHCLKS